MFSTGENDANYIFCWRRPENCEEFNYSTEATEARIKTTQNANYPTGALIQITQSANYSTEASIKTTKCANYSTRARIQNTRMLTTPME